MTPGPWIPDHDAGNDSARIYGDDPRDLAGLVLYRGNQWRWYAWREGMGPAIACGLAATLAEATAAVDAALASVEP